MNYKQIAKEVIEALGGRENVNSVAHCATRLRVMVKDENKINKEKAENIALNPMDYVNNKIIAYKNPLRSFPDPYNLSAYTGIMFNGYI